jgi:hypothetical protein
MWSLIPSLSDVLQGLSIVFTQPSFATQAQVLVGWVMCLGGRTEFRVFETILGRHVPRNTQHPFHRFYNFFNRSAWTIQDLARAVAVELVTRLDIRGELPLIVDGTLLHKSGRHVFGIGWFHDPVASTRKRIATALGTKWVVLGAAVPVPGTNKFFCLPIHALQQMPGTKQGEAKLARQMLEDVLEWFPDRRVLLVGDGGFSGKTLLRDLDERVRYVGLMRGDAALHTVEIPPRRKGQAGPNRKQGLRLPAPREVAQRADRARSKKSCWTWKRITADAYGETLRLHICSFQATWPKVFGRRPIQVVVCRPLEKGYDDIYLYTTDLSAKPAWVVETYARRNAIESLFKSSKQVMEIQKPQHWSKASVQKLAPWVWLMKSVVALWYLTEGRHLPEAKAARRNLGEWETEYSYRHMLRLLRRLTIREAINATRYNRSDLQQLAAHLENYLYLAA